MSPATSKDQIGPSDLDSKSDESLVRFLRRSDVGPSEDAATSLYLRYCNRLLGMTRARAGADLTSRVDAEEIVQSVFRTFFRRVSEGYYHAPSGEDLWKLLMVIALNKIRRAGEYHRAAKRDVRRTVGGVDTEVIQTAPAPNNESAYYHLDLVVQDALQHFKPRDRQMIELRLQGFEVAEIADRCGRSKRTVERVLQHSRDKLRLLFEG